MLALPFEDGSFEAATVGFGVRNVVDLEHGARGARARARSRRSPRDPRDHDTDRPAGAVLPALVRPDRAAAREGAEGRRGLLVPACERSPLPRPRRGPRRAPAGEPGSTASSTARSPAGSSRCTRGRSDDARSLRFRRRRASTTTSRSSRLGSSRPWAVTRGWLQPSRGTRSAPAGSGCARCSCSSRPRPARAVRRRGGGGRARPHGDARPRRPDRRRGVPPRPRIGLVGLRPGGRAGDRRLPLRTRLRGAGGDRRRAGGRAARGRSSLPRPRRGDAAPPGARPGHDRRGLPRALRAEDGETVRGFLPARQPRPRTIRDRARDRVPDHRRHPRLRAATRWRPGRSPVSISARGRRRCR